MSTLDLLPTDSPRSSQVYWKEKQEKERQWDRIQSEGSGELSFRQKENADNFYREADIPTGEEFREQEVSLLRREGGDGHQPGGDPAAGQDLVPEQEDQVEEGGEHLQHRGGHDHEV